MIVSPGGSIIVTTASFNWPAVRGGVRRSTDLGNSWSNSLNGYNARTLAQGDNGVIYASFWNYPSNEALYRSTNDGVSWGLVYSLSGSGNNIFAIASKQNNNPIFLGTRTGVLRSTDGGFSFPAVNNGIPANSWVRDLDISADGFIAAATTNGLFISGNDGANWQQITGIIQGDTVVKVEFGMISSDNNNLTVLYAGTIDGDLLKMPSGNFNDIVLLRPGRNSEVSDLHTRFGQNIANYLLASMFPHSDDSCIGIVRTTNSGLSFGNFNMGLPPARKISVVDFYDHANSSFYLAGTHENNSAGAKIYVRAALIGIKQISQEIPHGYSLSQNYPNPFNPATNIMLNVPKTGNVKLSVFDASGRLVEVLVDKQLAPGTYEANWNGGGYSSGVYYYRMSAGEFSETRKLVFVK
jgi:hypothetical protein